MEANCPEHENSGIYLWGRYEVQVGIEGGMLPDRTLIGRHVTVVRDTRAAIRSDFV